MELRSSSPSYTIILLHNHTQLHVFWEQAPYGSKSFRLPSEHNFYLQPTPVHHTWLHLNSRFEINNESTVVVKSKKQNFCYMNSVILCDYLEFLFVFKI